MASRLEGPLTAYRITIAAYALFDGDGAFLHGGRWNSPGRRVIYAAEHFAGAMLESLVHFNLGRVPRLSRFVRIDIPAGMAIGAIESGDAPGWDSADEIASRAYGDAWHEGGRAGKRPAVLLVPSAVAPLERNVAINQDHPEFGRIAASDPEPVVWDRRLFRRR